MLWRRDKRQPLSARQRVDLELLLRRTVEIIGSHRIQQAEWFIDLHDLIGDYALPGKTNDDDLISVVEQAVRKAMPDCQTYPSLVIVASDSLDTLSRYYGTEPEEESKKRSGSNHRAAKIELSDQLIADPLRLTMEIAFQYSVHFWHQIEPKHPLDLNPVTTQLLPICCGFGFLASDASLYDSQWSLVGYSGWTLSRSGYYTAEEIGYALGTLKTLKPEIPDNWLDRLRPDSRQVAEYVVKSRAITPRENRLFDAIQIPSSKCDPQKLKSWLEGDSPDFALAAIEAILIQKQIPHQIEKATLKISRSKDPSLIHAASKLLGQLAPASEALKQRIDQLIGHRDIAIAVEAIHSAVDLGMPLSKHIKKIKRLIGQLGEYGLLLVQKLTSSTTDLSVLIPDICKQLDLTENHKDQQPWITCLLSFLSAHAPDSEQAIQQHCRSFASTQSFLGETFLDQKSNELPSS